MSNATNEATRTCDHVKRDGTKCKRRTPGWGWLTCRPCYAAKKRAEAIDRKKRAAACWERGAVARAAMPEMAAWCAAASKAGRVSYLIPHVARSGMSRRIELFVSSPTGLDVCWPDIEPEQMKDEPVKAYRARLKAYRDTFRRLSWSWKHRCFVVGGCGMDMVFATMDAIGYVFGYYDFGNTIRRDGISRHE